MKNAVQSKRYMTRREVAAHYGVHEATIRQPSPRSRFVRLRQVAISSGMIRILRSDVDALDREILKAAMTPYGEKPAAEAEEEAA